MSQFLTPFLPDHPHAVRDDVFCKHGRQALEVVALVPRVVALDELPQRERLVKVNPGRGAGVDRGRRRFVAGDADGYLREI